MKMTVLPPAPGHRLVNTEVPEKFKMKTGFFRPP
jgi:hypothetical protein